ncbi:hypothetical protein Z946_959 [Sulfitobacter noctilucicola]|uniref:Uncharacterized protein n=1 Tax=Sulfitobacter noctilucicola TaxID=1342301 RepID=A0A7W6Q3A8_9RHOB|nr:DUF6173 family protein [Sulfitobacter noctilucicola]KIN62103.1 hypothetical protein Z946_959 [Sulfitobacter noctilucicola]MBB4173378.1 hypothetical protein [Sulfitobacter noctilucicola]
MDDKIMTAAEAVEADALPRIYEAHSDPDQESATKIELPESLSDKPMAGKSPAQWAYERTILYLKNFEEKLDAEHEVAMGFTGGDAGVLRIEGMGYFDPDIVTFYGTDPAGSRTQLVQHVSQLNVMFRALPKAVEGKAAKRIGFRLVQQLEQEQKKTA